MPPSESVWNSITTGEASYPFSDPWGMATRPILRCHTIFISSPTPGIGPILTHPCSANCCLGAQAPSGQSGRPQAVSRRRFVASDCLTTQRGMGCPRSAVLAAPQPKIAAQLQLPVGPPKWEIIVLNYTPGYRARSDILHVVQIKPIALHLGALHLPGDQAARRMHRTVRPTCHSHGVRSTTVMFSVIAWGYLWGLFSGQMCGEYMEKEESPRWSWAFATRTFIYDDDHLLSVQSSS